MLRGPRLKSNIIIKKNIGVSSLPWRQVATRCDIPNSWNATYTAVRSRSGHIARSTITKLKLLFPNWWVDGMIMGSSFAEMPVSGTRSILASIEYPSGTFTRVTFSGGNTGTLPSGGSLLSDAVNVSIPNGATFWVRNVFTGGGGMFSTGDVGENSPAVFNSTTFGDTCDINTATDNTMGGTYGGTDASPYIYRPVAILAQTTNPSVLMIGDSRCHGSGGAADTTGDYGEVARSVGPYHGYTNYSMGSYAASHVVSSHSRLATLAPYYSHFICQLGINDFADASLTASALLTRLQTIWGYFSGLTICQTTLSPSTTSTDGWATTANQTIKSYEAARSGLNDLLRAGPTGLNVLFEVADATESARNSGKWKAPGYTADGVHETSTGYIAIKDSGAISSTLTGAAFSGGQITLPYTQDFSSSGIPFGFSGVYNGPAPNYTTVVDNAPLSNVGGKLRVATDASAGRIYPRAVFAFPSVPGHTHQLSVGYTPSATGVPYVRVTTDPNGGNSSLMNSGDLSGPSPFTTNYVVPSGATTLYLCLFNDNDVDGYTEFDDISIIDQGVATTTLPDFYFLSSADITSFAGRGIPQRAFVAANQPSTYAIATGLNGAECTLTDQVLFHPTGAAGKQVIIEATRISDGVKITQTHTYRQKTAIANASGLFAAFAFPGWADNWGTGYDGHPRPMDYSIADAWYAFSVKPDVSGVMEPDADKYWYRGTAWGGQVIQGAHAAGKLGLISMGGGGVYGNIYNMLSDDTKRINFVNAFIAHADSVNADGMIFDIEKNGTSITDQEWLWYIDLSKRVRAAKPNWYIGMDHSGVSALKGQTPFIWGPTDFFPSFASHCDWVELMNYVMNT
jgi:hypothetical protein